MSITSSGSNPSENIIRNLFIQQGMPSPKYMVVTGRLGEYNEQTRQVMLYVGDAEVEIPLTVDEKTPIAFRKVTSPDEDPFSLWDLGPRNVPSMAALAASDDIATTVDNNIFFRDCIESVTRRAAYTDYRPLALAEGTVYLHADGTQTFQLNRMTVASYLPGLYRWEDHSYWAQHLNQLMESRLAFLFDDISVIDVEDIGKHWLTNINSLGEPKGDIIETATLARFTYGAASVALVNDNKQARDAAKAAAEFQIRELADNTGDSNIRLWLHGKSRDENGRVTLIKPAGKDDGLVGDRAHIPLYEQIYDIAGLTQTFLVTRNKALLVNVVRTMNAFDRFFKVEGRRGWWSHIDVTTHQPCEERLGINKGGINWNSVGDHIPAYLFSLLAALGPKYKKSNADADLNELREHADDMLKEAVEIIVREFPGEDHPTVRERFNLDEEGNFVYNSRYGWQKNRAIIGHNFKIVWNLTRAANYFNAQGDRAERAGHSELADDYRERAQSAAQLAERLNDDMMRLGIDPVSFLLHDGIERQPTIPGELQVPWGPHGDFWQHEQVVHALGEQYGWHMRLGNVQKAEKILEYWRKLNLVWTEKFLDQVNRSVHFRINDQFSPIAQSYNHIGGIDIAGYHESEYALLQNFMTKMYLTKKPFSLTFDLDAHRVIEGTVDEYVSVAGDAWVLGLARIIRVAVNGTPFEIPMEGNELVPNPEEPIINLQQMGLDGANNLKATKLTVWFQPKSWEEYWQEHNITPVSTQVPALCDPKYASPPDQPRSDLR